MGFFFIIFFFLLAMGSWYLWVKLVDLFYFFDNKTNVKRFWALVLTFFWVLVLATRMAFALIPDLVPGYFFWIGYTFLGLWALLIFGFAFFDFLRLPKTLYQMYRRQVPLKTKSLFLPERRAFFSNLKDVAVVGYALGSTATGSSDFFLRPQIKKVEVPLPPAHTALRGLKIAQISDVHIGPILKHDFVQEIVSKVNDLKPDLICVTGDLVDGSVSHLLPEMQGFKFFQSKYGVFYCPGNHEIYSGLYTWMEGVKSLGWKPLLNEHEVLEINGHKLCIGGVHDLSVPRHHPELVSSPRRAFHNSPDEAYRLLLAHQPKSCYEAELAKVHLQLSGHTHGGQFFPWSLVVYLAHPYVKGLNRHSENLQVYVNVGTGWWGPPNRLGVPGEITLLHLV